MLSREALPLQVRRTALEAYLAWRARGMEVETPAVRP
jgi:hypothetical protein